MAGRRDFSPERFWTLFAYVGRRLPYVAQAGGPEAILAVMFALDFQAYAQLGASLTGSAWVKEYDGWQTALTWPG